LYVPREVLDTTVFIGREGPNGKTIGGTGFLVSVPLPGVPDGHSSYLVTAGHCVAGRTGLFMRVNSPTGDGTVDVLLPDGDEWWRHPLELRTVDLAVLPIPDPWALDVAGYRWVPLSMFVQDEDFLTDDAIDHGLGIGDDVVSIGLFTVHQGSDRNAPVVRRGTIAMIPDELVWANDDMGFMDLYLIELRSIGGMSGSPVFAAHRSLIGAHGVLSFLGVGLGHYLTPARLGDDDETDAINLGIGMVAPARELLEVLNQEALAGEREDAAKAIRKRAARTEGVMDWADEEGRVSLEGIDPDDALRAMLATPPPKDG
jgi:hypothetical protein